MIGALLTVAVVAAVIGATVRADRRDAVKLASAYGEFRRMATHDLTFADPTPEQAASLDVLERPAGMRRLGDVVACYGDTHEMPLRLFVDAAGTTLGVAGSFMGPFLDLCSFAAEHVTITHACKLRYPFCDPPFVRRKALGAKPVAAVVAAHLDRIGGLTDLYVAGTLDDAKRELMRMQSRQIAWRTTMDIDELLELDLRAYLGSRYQVLGAALARQLRELPGARVVITPARTKS